MNSLGENVMLKEDFQVIALLTCKNIEGNLDRVRIEQTVRVLASIHNFNEHIIEEVVKQVESRLVTTMEPGVSLVDLEENHDYEWVNNKEDLSWNYWNEYKEQLLLEGWGDKVLHTLDEVTDKILGLLKDPQATGEWKRRGLVVGHVQSGKTANYIGLISKAADAGYRFIIVIAGIHNNLRKQTQKRIDEGFVGLTADGEKKARVGVGTRNISREDPVPLTNTVSDFNKKVASVNSGDLKLYEKAGRPAILVIKKNVTTLKRLYEWLRDLNADKMGQISKTPMLLIDDEADNASINTNKPDLDPTKTNAWIRQLLKLFNMSCYVGYTATPFANIFINPKDEDEMIGDDLFPRDFIYCLDAPSNYFGAEKVFLDDEISHKVLRTISDAEDYIPLSHKRYDLISALPPSAKKAIQTFILARAIRDIRRQDNKHCTMMINVSRFVDTQRQVREHVSHYLAELQDAIFINYRKPSHEALLSPMFAGIKSVYDNEYSECPESWEQVQGALHASSDEMKTYLVNSKSDEVLDYGKYEESGDALTALAIGGLSLSRGLTLEGLTVSYMYRNSKMYDTLMQMGRWFGYRSGYDDLCRVYLSEDSQGWYAHISEASEDLRQQIKQMRRDGFSPKDFGLYVRAHPDALIVTALNKMWHAEKKSLSGPLCLDNKFRETYVLPKDSSINLGNLDLISSFYSSLQERFGRATIDTCFAKGSHCWCGVSTWDVLDFIEKYRFHKDIYWLKSGIIAYTKAVADLYDSWDVVFVSLSKSEHISDIVPIAIQKRQIGYFENKPKPTNEEPGWHVGSKQKIAGLSLEGAGLNESQISKVHELADGKKVQDRLFRNKEVRNKPLLVLHILDLYDMDPRDKNAKILASNIPAIGCSYPASGKFRPVDCVVNKIWLANEMVDAQGEDDDFGSD
jgi:hypothetical protein